MSKTYFAAAAAALLFGAAAMAADVIKTTTGEAITGRVLRFKRNVSSAGASSFVIDVDGEERSIPLNKLDEITFERASAPPAPSPATRTSPARSDATAEKGGGYWMSSSGKRHNSSCRDYGSGKGRSCGEKEGTPCKVCGG